MAKKQHKPGRNAPCPCGSGKKSKACCLKSPSQSPTGSPSIPQNHWILEEDTLDLLSNAIVDLIDQGNLDEAERRAIDLRKRHPEVIDGIERLAMVAEARGDRQHAADLYRQVVTFVDSHEGFDPESRQYYVKKVAALSS